MPDPFDEETPRLHPFFGQPDSTFDLVNQYGTYNIQPTAETENPFPAIAQGTPKAWRDKVTTKKELE